MFLSSSDHHEPLFWLGGRAIRTVPLLLGLYIFATVAVALLMATAHQDIVQLFVYNSNAVAHGEVWRLLSYTFINGPSVWFALEMGMFFFFGRLIEIGIGSKSFALFYGGLVILQGVLFQVADLFGQSSEAHGIEMISMALFAAFAAMVPSAPFFFGIAARWMLLLLIGISELQLLAEKQWLSMIQLCCLSGAAIFYMKKSGYREPLYFFSSDQLKKLMKPVLPKPMALPLPTTAKEDHRFTGSTIVATMPTADKKRVADVPLSRLQVENKKNISMLHVDQLLDKINATGLNSLTEQEKAKLEAARAALLERDQEG